MSSSTLTVNSDSSSSSPSQSVEPLPLAAAEFSLSNFVAAIPSGCKYVGLSASYDTQRKLSRLSVSCEANKSLTLRVCGVKGRALLRFRAMLGRFLASLIMADRTLIAFDAETIAAGLFLDCGIPISRLVSVQRIHPSNTLDGLAYLSQFQEEAKFTKAMHHSFLNNRAKCDGSDSAARARAWTAAQIAVREERLVQATKFIDTASLSDEVLLIVCRVIRNSDQLESLKPEFQKHDFDSATINRNGELVIAQSRFKTRVRMYSEGQVTRITFKGKKDALPGNPKRVKGRSATFIAGNNSRFSDKNSADVNSVTTYGKESSTSNEKQLKDLLITVLEGNSGLLLDNRVVQRIWSLKNIVMKQAGHRSPLKGLSPHVTSQLNAAQEDAVISFCGTTASITAPHIQLIHGPPGSGKTSVIVAITQWLGSQHNEAVYIISQSNVAVKNVAEKLVKIGFKLIVSEDFYYEWHNHLYEGVEKHLIRSSKLPEHSVDMQQTISGVRVILCTLSMLSNPRLGKCGLTTSLLPPSTIIVDKASQIGIGDYLPILSSFKGSLRRLCFVGDHKQLAPFGQSEVPGIKSIFEMEHLVREAHFLNTQYRMPKPIGDFISEHVYDGRLLTSHPTNHNPCVCLVDVEGEESKKGFSSKNDKEARAAVRVAKQLGTAGKRFRILTAYDAQRQLIEDMLKKEGIPWEDKVFNVDSFQGSEDDYIILSIVRTVGPGFLSDARRTNVMLSRSKKGMVILAKRQFLMEHTRAQDTLVSKMALEVGMDKWYTEGDILNGRIELLWRP